MTKKDYIKIADAFHRRVDLANALQTRAERITHLHEMAVDLCDVFEQDNEAFDRARFMKACGLTKEVQ